MASGMGRCVLTVTARARGIRVKTGCEGRVAWRRQPDPTGSAEGIRAALGGDKVWMLITGCQGTPERKIHYRGLK